MESRHKKIAPDTNVLVSIADTKIDVLEEAKKDFGSQTEFVVPEAVVRELDSLAKNGKTMKKSCEIAKMVLKNHNVKTVKTIAAGADSALLELSKDGVAVMTVDRELKRRIKKALGEIIELSKGHIKSIDS
jgi:rRNA-processing protein FCF1